MKLIYYSPHPGLALNSQTGYGTHMREMIAAFENAGHEVVPVINGGLEEHFNSGHKATLAGRLKATLRGSVRQEVWEGLKDWQLLRKDLRFYAKLTEVVERVRPDVIYERANYLQLSGVKVARQYGVCHVVEMNTPYVEVREKRAAMPAFMRAKADRIEHEQLSRADLAVFVSAALRDTLVTKHHLDVEKCDVGLMAIDPGKVKSCPQKVSGIRTRYGLDGSLVIGYAGSIFPWHGVDVLIRALAKLQSERHAVKLVIVGDGAIMPDLKELAHTLGIRDRLVFTGRIPHADVFNYIDVMDIAVLPQSHWYGSPTKLFEYGAMGKPIIAPDNGPVREIMVNGEDGLLVAGGVEELTDALRQLASDPALCRRLAESFKTKVLAQHTWTRNADRVCRFVEEATASLAYVTR